MPAKCKIREQLRQSGNEDTPPLPLGAVRGYRCFRCFDPSDKIMKCTACKRVGYCSKACQKLDWTAVHKTQCKVLKQVNERDLTKYHGKITWESYRIAQLQHVRLLRETTTVPDVTYIVQAQPYCSNCYRSMNQVLYHGETLQPCLKCRLAHHCSACPDLHPDSACVLYQRHNEIEQFRIELFEDVDRATVIECTQKPRHKYILLKDYACWYDYFTKISDKQYVGDCITRDMGSITQSARQEGAERRVFEERRRLFLILATESLTIPLTIMQSLEALGLCDAKSIDIHLLGATAREFLTLTIFEELLHILPTLTRLVVTAVGPSAVSFNSGHDSYSAQVELPCCPDCQRNQRKREIASYKGLYHDFRKTSAYRKPTLIVAFNTGFVDGDDAASDWAQTIQMIARGDTPALFTTYNEREAQNEQIKLNSLGVHFVVEPTRNPWRSLVEEPELLDEEYSRWCQNDYYYVISGTKPSTST